MDWAKTRWETFKFWDLVRLVLEILRYHFLAPTRLESWHPWSPKATWTNTTRIAKSTALKRGTSRKRHKLSYGRIVVVMLVNTFMLSLFWPFSYSLMQFPPSILKLFTQHPPYFFKLSIQHQPAITRIENCAVLPTQGLKFSYKLIRSFSKIFAYTKTVHFYSTKNTSMNKFLVQSSSPFLMLGGIPPASLSEGWEFSASIMLACAQENFNLQSLSMDLVGFKGTLKPVFLYTTDVNLSPQQCLHYFAISFIQGSQIPSGNSDIDLGLLHLLYLLNFNKTWIKA